MENSVQGAFAFCRANDIRALAFDCDGVLLNSGRSYFLAYERVLREAGAHVSAREIYLEEGRPTPEVLRVMLQRHGVPFQPAMIPDLVEKRREYQSEIGGRESYPDVLRLLSKLHISGFMLAMVTGSSRKSVDQVLTEEMKRLLDVVITADDVAQPKPEPQPFQMAAAAMGVSPEHCLAIENAPYGIQAAKSAGSPVIAICTTLDAEDLQGADWIVPNHTALEMLLESGPGNSKALSSSNNVFPGRTSEPW